MASTRWRLNISAGNGPTYLGIATLRMAATAAGADLCTGGTASASTVDSAPYAAAMAFDGNAATYWSTSGAGGTVGWLEYLFPSPVTVAEYSVQSSNVGGAYAPQAWTLESWDGAAWVVADTRTSQTAWGVGQTRTYTVVAVGPPARVQSFVWMPV